MSRRDDDGAAMVEYVVLVTFVALAAVAAVGILGGNVLDLFDLVGDSFPG